MSTSSVQKTFTSVSMKVSRTREGESQGVSHRVVRRVSHKINWYVLQSQVCSPHITLPSTFWMGGNFRSNCSYCSVICLLCFKNVSNISGATFLIGSVICLLCFTNVSYISGATVLIALLFVFYALKM